MFHTCSPDELAGILRSFDLPMFAAERLGPEQPFVVICSNAAHQKATGLAAHQVEGKPLGSFLPPEEARRVTARYDACARTRQNRRYVQKQLAGGRIVLWDTSLQYVSLDNGGERIIGTAQEVLQANTYPLYDDIRYFSSLAELQLENLTTVLDAAQKQGLFREHSEARVSRLSALCRGVQRAVEDIRTTVHRADSAQGREFDKKSAERMSCGSTLEALNKASEETAT